MCGDRPPPCLLHLGTLDALLSERRDLGLQIVTHEIEFVSAGIFGGMNRHFRGRKRKDQPSVAGIHGGKSDDVSEESPIGSRVLAGYDDMRTKDHDSFTFQQYSAILLNVCQMPARRDVLGIIFCRAARSPYSSHLA